MTNDTIAAIRAAAERILRNIDFTHYSLHAEQDDAAREILRLLDEAENDAVQVLHFPAPPGSGEDDYWRCDDCGEDWQMRSIANFCPGCGRRIEGGVKA